LEKSKFEEAEDIWSRRLKKSKFEEVKDWRNRSFQEVEVWRS
jgi:hypothetical protein